MKLVKCHIEGFGKFRDKDMSFENGINVICEDNGFGKTTLATFLKTMFYGFEDETKRNSKDKEREKYRPWDKGIYGGRIVFENNGKTYEVSRTFGKNATDDSFDLRDCATNAVSKDFTKDNLGTELFGIDKASFFRTTYFASKDRENSAEVTGSIRAKLGNLTDATDDINNYETVCDKFASLMNEYNPDRKPGKIKVTKVKIAELENELRDRVNVDKSIEILENQMVSERGRIERNKEKIAALKEELRKSNEAASRKAKRETYNSIKAEYEESAKNASEAACIFGKRIPSMNEIEEISKADIENRQLLKTMNVNRFFKDDEWNSLEAKFADEIPKENEISEMLRLWSNREECRKNADSLTRSKEEAAKRYIEAEKERKDKEIAAVLEQARISNEARMAKKKRLVVYSVVTFCLFVIAAFFTRNLSIWIHIPVSAAFLTVSVALAAYIKIKHLDRIERFGAERPRETDLEEEAQNCDEARALDMQISEKRDEIVEYEYSVRKFLEKYKEEFDENNVTVTLFGLADKLKKYEEGLKKTELFENAEKEYLERENKIDAFFEDIGVRQGDDRAETTSLLREALVKKEQFDRETERKELILRNFEADNNIDGLFKEEETIKDSEDIEEEIAELEEEIDRAKTLNENFRTRLSDEQDKRDVLLNKEAEVLNLKEELAEYEDFYRIMNLTKGYLAKAKDELSLKYTGPTMDAFRKYCAYFDDKAGDDFRIDTNFNLTKIEEGMQRDMKELSYGLRDAADFCLRLSFADAMYKEEKPFLILDDPFVNFDSKNLEAAGKVLEKVKNDYQVIYFTCHESRGGV